MPTFTILPEEKKERLDKYLTKKLAISRSQVKKLIEKGRVLINGEKPTVHHFLKPGEQVVVLETEEVKEMIIPDIEILKNERDYVVINKSAGVLTHAAKGSPNEASVVDWLLNKFPKVKEVGNPLRPGIVHRLDKQTSGVMVIAKTQKMFESLKQQFKDREVEKQYLALVYGNLPELSGTINKPIGRSKKSARMATRV